jgi:hypothetical protein
VRGWSAADSLSYATPYVGIALALSVEVAIEGANDKQAIQIANTIAVSIPDNVSTVQVADTITHGVTSLWNLAHHVFQ